MSAPSLPDGTVPLRRCCPRHDDWQTLAEHLIADLPEVGERDVLRELASAKTAVASFGLPESEQLDIAELTARHQLLLLSGDVADIARLDPERHERRDGTT